MVSSIAVRQSQDVHVDGSADDICHTNIDDQGLYVTLQNTINDMATSGMDR